MGKKRRTVPRTVATTADKAKSARAELGELTEGVRERTAARQADELAAFGERGRELLDQGVPRWCVAVHSRVGHVGGLVVFSVVYGLAWVAGAALTVQLLRLVGVELITRVPTATLSWLGTPSQVVTSSTDRFLFSWVMPVAFFVIVIALCSAWTLRATVRWALRQTRLAARGLFAGYGTGVIEDWRERRLSTGHRRAARARLREDKARRRARAAAAAAADGPITEREDVEADDEADDAAEVSR